MKIHELHEAIGSDAIDIAEWIAGTEAAPHIKDAARRMCAQLLKMGFKYSDDTRTLNNDQLGFMFYFPTDRPGQIQMMFRIDYFKGTKIHDNLTIWRKNRWFLSAKEIMDAGVQNILDRTVETSKRHPSPSK